MTIPDLRFDIRGRDQSGAAFASARRNVGDTRRQMKLLNADVRAATASITGIGKSALIGAVGIGSLAAAVHKMKVGLADFDRIAKVARQSGLDGEFYQTLAFMAGEASVEVSTLDTALRKFTVGISEAANGTGTLYTQLKRSNPELLTSLLNAEDGEARFRMLAEAIRGAATAEQRMGLAAAAFGTRGAELVRVLELGSDAMDQAADKASDLGNIIEDHVLDQAEEMQNRLGNASDALDKQLNAALISASPLMVNFYENMASVVKITREWSTELDGIPEALAKVGNAGFFKQLNVFLASNGLLNLGDAKILDKDLKDAVEGNTSNPGRVNGGGGWGSGGSAAQVISSLGGVAVTPRSKPVTATKSWPDPLARTPVSPAEKELERREKAYERVIEQLNRETAALGMNASEQRIANELARAGVSANSDRGREIARIVTQLDRERAAQDAVNQRVQFFVALGGGAFQDLITGAEDLEGVMRRVGLSIADAAWQMALFGQGPMGGGSGGLAGLVTSFFGGGGGIAGLGSSAFAGWYADGGAIGAGKLGIAGEAGYPEVVTGPAHVWTPADLAAIAGGGGGGGEVFAPTYNIDARGAQEGVAQQIKRALEDYDSHVAPETARKAVGRANRTSSSGDFRRR